MLNLHVANASGVISSGVEGRVCEVCRIFLDLPGHSDATNRQNLPSSIDWWHQTGLGGPGTYLTMQGAGKNWSVFYKA